jgi:hypothetical protein
VTRLLRLAAAAALLASAATALAFKRSPVLDELGDPIAGRFLFWRAPRQVTYVLNAAAANAAGCAPGEAVVLARASFATWTLARLGPSEPQCTDFLFLDGGQTTSTVAGYVEGGPNQNLVVWRRGACSSVVPAADPCFDQGPGACADQHNCFEEDPRNSAAIAITTTTFKVSTGELLDADLELFDRDEASGSGFWLTCPGPGAPPCAGRPDGRCVAIDLGSTVTHEAGHVLGLGHTCERPNESGCGAPMATMVGTAAAGETHKRVLHVDDVVGVCTVYPSGQPTPSSTAQPPTEVTGGGCATGGASASGLLLAAAALLRALVRRR